MQRVVTTTSWPATTGADEQHDHELRLERQAVVGELRQR
jgi:hypothetical protein